ncbi:MULTISPECIES: ComF family protein [unclassified Luteococcus]|uniref:ComF family protein n=1 Tax=unclassified Luteococcus TaxID=2639923 RepID=UPI00313B183B
MTMTPFLRRVLDALFDLLLGACCPGCQRAGLGLCATCRAGLPVVGGPMRDTPALGPALVGRVYCAGRYAGPLREMLSAHKDRGAWTLTGVLAGQLWLAVEALLQDLLPRASPATMVALVPIPSSPRSVRERGFDHATALVRGVVRRRRGSPEAGGPTLVVVPALRRVHRVADQSALGREQRVRNQRGSMRARPPRGVRLAVLCDDICTTGASLTEGERALRAAGWTVLGAAVVAHPQRFFTEPLKRV